MTFRDKDEARVGRPVFDAAIEMALATIPGFFSLNAEAGKDARPYGVYSPASISSELVPQQVCLLGAAPVTVNSVAPAHSVAAPGQASPRSAQHGAGAAAEVVGARARMPIGRLVGTCSGDKGGNANLGVFVRSQAAWPWLAGFLTVERLQDLLPETRGLRVDRFEFPHINALNFVIHGLLQEGVAASTRQDAQAKSLGEWLRAREVELPLDLLNSAEAP